MGPFDLVRNVVENLRFSVDKERSEHENTLTATRNAAVLAAAIAVEPVPWLDLIVLVPLQVKLVLHIAHIHGFHITRERAKRVILEFGGAAAFGFGMRQVLRGVAKIALPVVGGLITAPVAYAGVYALGLFAERYFRAQREDLPALTAEELQVWRRDLLGQGRKAAERVGHKDLERLRDELQKRSRERRELVLRKRLS